MAHWSTYFHVAVYVVLGGAAVRHLSVAVVRVFGAMTKDRKRSRQSLEMVRLSRRDAKGIPTYLDTVSDDHELTDGSAPPPADQDSPGPANRHEDA